MRGIEGGGNRGGFFNTHGIIYNTRRTMRHLQNEVSSAHVREGYGFAGALLASGDYRNRSRIQIRYFDPSITNAVTCCIRNRNVHCGRIIQFQLKRFRNGAVACSRRDLNPI